MKRVRMVQTIFSLVVLFSLVLTACTPKFLSPTESSGINGEATRVEGEDSVPLTGDQRGAGQISSAATTITGTGDITAQVDEFRNLLGNDNGGEPGVFDSGRREINWDGIPDELAAPVDYLGDFFNASVAPRARGLIMVTPGKNFMVSANSANSEDVQPRFGNLNPTYPDIFQAFSEERIFAPMGSNVFDVGFFVPGAERPALVRGFGAVFIDVDGNDTFIELFDQKGKTLGRYTAPAAQNGFSFVGAVFDEPLIYRVRVKLGNTPLGPDDADGFDVVAMDDFIYGEPQALTGAVVGKIEAPKAGSAIRNTDTLTETATTTETVSLTPTESPAVVTVPEEFLMNFDDAGDKRLASFTVDLAGLPPAPAGKTYVVWLMDYSRNYVSVGEAVPGQVFIYTDPGGKNLISRFRGAALSLEDSESVLANTVKTPSEVHFSGELPPDILPLIQKLVVAAADTPGQTPYGYGLREQTGIAIHHAEVLVESLQGNDLPSAKMHLEHLWNTLVGFHSPEYGDLNGDGKAENYGDGFGALLYASRLVGILDQISELQSVNDHYRQGASKAAQCARVVANILAPEVKTQGRSIFAAQEASSVLQAGEIVDSAVQTMANGFDTDGNGTIDPSAGECGASQVWDLVHRLYHVHMAKNPDVEHNH